MNSQEALSQLQQAQNTAANPQDLLSQQQNQLGVGGQRSTVQGLRGAIGDTTKLLQQIAPSVRGRTGSSLVTNAQATRQIANEQAPVSENLNQQNAAYSDAARDLSDLESRAQQAASAAYTGQQDRLSYLQNLYNTVYQREQDDLSRQERDAAAKEASRLASIQLGGMSGSGGSNTGSTGSPRIEKAGGAFKFYSPAGSPINAAEYVQLASAYGQKIGYRELLARMAAEGDNNARVALNYVGNDGKFGSAPEDARAALMAVGASGNYASPSGSGQRIVTNNQGIRVPTF